MYTPMPKSSETTTFFYTGAQEQQSREYITTKLNLDAKNKCLRKKLTATGNRQCDGGATIEDKLHSKKYGMMLLDRATGENRDRQREPKCRGSRARVRLISVKRMYEMHKIVLFQCYHASKNFKVSFLPYTTGPYAQGVYNKTQTCFFVHLLSISPLLSCSSPLLGVIVLSATHAYQLVSC